MTVERQLLERAYRAFNARDIDSALTAMHADVAWSNGMEGGYVHGHEGVREYWSRQWGSIDPHVEPLGFDTEDSGRTVVQVHLLVRSLDGKVLKDQIVEHVYVIEDGLIRSMGIRESPTKSPGARWRVAVGGDETTVIWEPATTGGRRAVFVCAHGAGGHMDDRGLLALSKVLRSQILDVVRFNFLYREKGSGRPDAMPRLLDCLVAVVARVRDELRPDALIIGGRSMGGRAASVLAADGFPCEGLLLLAYPLHPAGQPERLRDAHLPSIACPVLCVNGTRDALCRRELMEGVLTRLGSNWTMHWLEGADHSFHVLKSSGTTDAAVLLEAGKVTGAWVSALERPERGRS
jgi:uncharacterized protein